jgi:hypothetical protein
MNPRTVTLARRILTGIDYVASFVCFLGIVAIVGGAGMIAVYTAARESFKAVLEMAENHKTRYFLIALVVCFLWCWARWRELNKPSGPR